MAMDDQAHGQVRLAVSELALGEGPLRERLDEAWLHLMTLQANDLPEGLRPAFRAMESAWLSSSVADLSGDQVREAGAAILALEEELSRQEPG
jgi:hypothetical protein